MRFELSNKHGDTRIAFDEDPSIEGNEASRQYAIDATQVIALDPGPVA